MFYLFVSNSIGFGEKLALIHSFYSLFQPKQKVFIRKLPAIWNIAFATYMSLISIK